MFVRGSRCFFGEIPAEFWREGNKDSRVTDVQDTGNLQFKEGPGDVSGLDIQNPTVKRKVLVFCT